MPAGLMKLINGLPTMVQPYDQSIYYSTGLAASTTITLPNSQTFASSTAADLLVMMNDTVVEYSPNGTDRDFTVVGSGPYTGIQFIYALPNNSVVRFKQVIG